MVLNVSCRDQITNQITNQKLYGKFHQISSNLRDRRLIKLSGHFLEKRQCIKCT